MEGKLSKLNHSGVPKTRKLTLSPWKIGRLRQCSPEAASLMEALGLRGEVTASCSGHTSSEQAQNNNYLSKPGKEFQVYLPLPAGEGKSKLSFGLGSLSQVFCSFQTELAVTPSVPISGGFYISLPLASPYQISESCFWSSHQQFFSSP